MKRIAVFFSLLFLLVLAACGAAEPETAVSPPTNDDQPTAQPSATNSATADTAANFTPAASVAEAAKIRAVDQTHGASVPLVTIIEYGDFQ